MTAKYSGFNTKQKKQFWKENPIHGEIEIELKGVKPFKMYCENDDTVVKELHWTDSVGWELTSLTLWTNLLKKLEGPSVIYDVGSYTGIYSLIASRISESNNVFAFDIQSNCVERLRKNIDINGVSNIKENLCACANKAGVMEYHYYEEEGIISSVAGLMDKEMNDLTREVKSIRLDDFKNDNHSNDPIRLVKIDVEGAEKQTLAGMSEILNSDECDVLIEINDSKEIKGVREFFPKSYRVYDIDEDRLMIKKLGLFKKPSHHRNYLFTTKTKTEISAIFDGTVK